MICWTSFLNRGLFLPLLFGMLLTGCVGKEPGPPPLKVETVAIAAEGAVAKRDALRVNCVVSGGAGGVVYDFRILKEAVETTVFRGQDPALRWIPKEPGAYRFKVIATDGAGTVAASGWSDVYRFTSPLDKSSLYAVLPVENLSDRKAPLGEIRDGLIRGLSAAGLRILDDEALEGFMRKHRIRDVGGLSALNGEQIREELGVDGVVISSLETWYESVPPRISLISRIVATGKEPEIVWIDSVGLAGDEAPGLLGLGRINHVGTLLDTAVKKLVASFEVYLAGNFPGFRQAADQQGVRLLNGSAGTADGSLGEIRARHQPRFSYRSPAFAPALEYRVAVIPFLNVNARKHAGRIVALHLVKQLHRYENIRVFEPGRIRDILLHYRMIMQSGPSLAAADVLANEKILGADLILSGQAFDYQDAIGENKVDFSIQAFAGPQREVIWQSRSYAQGDDGVYFFDLGRIPTAHELASLMTRAAVQRLEE